MTDGDEKVRKMKQKNLDDLRIIISEEIDKLKDGETSAAAVNAISNACGKYLSSIKLELEIYKMTGKTPQLAGLLPDRSQQ